LSSSFEIFEDLPPKITPISLGSVFGFWVSLAPEGLGRCARMFTSVESTEAQTLKPEETGDLLAVRASVEFQVNVPYLFPLVTIAAYTGLRPSEYKKLSKADIDLEHRAISVKKSKSKSGVREIPMTDKVFEVLSHWLPEVKGQWVFPSPRKPGTFIQDFGKAFAKAAEKAGLVGVSPYSLRHTFATELDARVRRAVVAKLMGPSRERHTAPYLHPEWNEWAAAVKALPVPADFTTLTKGWEGGLESDRGQIQGPQELVMVGPWGLEPQTSTVSR
jgi:hypothetical protein